MKKILIIYIICTSKIYEKILNAYYKGIRIDKEEFKKNREKLFKG